MSEMTLISWNVNGIRAVSKKEVHENLKFNDWLNKLSPDILCIQEIKAQIDQLTEQIISPQGYTSYWHSAERKGYSGVATYSKTKPVRVNNNLGIEKFDVEGRVVETEFNNFTLFNVYFPNGKLNKERLRYKLDFYDAFLDYVIKLKEEGKSIIICGDVNTAHAEIDLTHAKANENISGFLEEEREWIDRLIAAGFIDSFRKFNKGPEHYTWWSMRNIGARDRNVGWRIDYFFVSKDLEDKLTDAYMLSDVMGSDHCPIVLKLKL
ncbi:MAG: exodeoxyribonuclease III [Candidatus Heimdallarchaeota archaeon]|nr:exodeoxyribonuclease III [Candidatus Heimdallarchaeota archaeon]MCK4253415.1 exodeoxyribonuclease III [Candidatus Heimdallarchaeota archaeon]